MQTEHIKIKNITQYFVFPILLTIYCFFDFNKGVDLKDTGYNLERFFNFLECDGNSVLSTFWGNYIGYFFSKLPGGDSWVGMLFYCTMVILAIVLVAYYFCIQFLDYRVVFICEVISLSLFWNPAAVLYNSLSFLLLEISVVLIFCAIRRDSNLLFVCAGIVLGINALVRMPNITEVVLIVLVWCYAWKKKKELKRDRGLPWWVEKTGQCVIGYLIGVVISVVFSLRFYEIETYIEVFTHLSGNTTLEGYGLGEMAFGTFMYIFEHSKYVAILILMMIIFWSFLVFCQRYLKKKNKMVCNGIYVVPMLCSIMFFYIAYRRFSLFTMMYNEYSSIKSLMALIYLWGIIVSIINILFKPMTKEVMASILYLILLWVIPLGSNNQIYLDITNSFILLPAICYMTKSFVSILDKLKHGMEAKNIFWSVSLPFIVLVIIQTMQFGATFTFGDNNAEEKFEHNNIMYGMYSSEKKVKALNELIDTMENIDVEYSGVLQYCYSPGLIYILQEKRGIEHTWPELATYPLQDFREELEGVTARKEFPLIIIDRDLAEFFEVIYKGYESYVENEDIYFADKKVRVLTDFMNENGYEQIYDDKRMYTIYAVQ